MQPTSINAGNAHFQELYKQLLNHYKKHNTVQLFSWNYFSLTSLTIHWESQYNWYSHLKTWTKPSNIKSLYVWISKKKKKQQFSNFFPLFKKGGESNIGHGFLFLFLLQGKQDLIKANNSSIIIKTQNKACKHTMNTVDGKKIKMMCKLRWRAKYIIQIFISH